MRRLANKRTTGESDYEGDAELHRHQELADTTLSTKWILTFYNNCAYVMRNRMVGRSWMKRDTCDCGFTSLKEL